MHRAWVSAAGGHCEGQRLLRHHRHEAMRRMDARRPWRKGYGSHVMSHWHALVLQT